MKLTARKTLVALGTTAAISLSGLTAPAMAADATAKSDTTATATTSAPATNATPAPAAEKPGDALYSEKYRLAMNDYNSYKSILEGLPGQIDAKRKAVGDDSDALSKVNSAKRHADDAQYKFTQISWTGIADSGMANSPQFGEIKANLSLLADVKREIDAARDDLAAAKPFSCDKDSTEATDDSSSGSSFLDFGSLVKSFGSSGEMQVTKDGKKKCVSRVDYYSDKLKSIVSILTVLFTVITTVTKINETIQKQVMPK